MTSRRSFLKIITALPILACVKPPEEIIKPKPKPIVTWGDMRFEPVILDFDFNFDDKFLDRWGKLVNVERLPLETDEQLRRRILIARNIS